MSLLAGLRTHAPPVVLQVLVAHREGDLCKGDGVGFHCVCVRARVWVSHLIWLKINNRTNIFRSLVVLREPSVRDQPGVGRSDGAAQTGVE